MHYLVVVLMDSEQASSMYVHLLIGCACKCDVHNTCKLRILVNWNISVKCLCEHLCENVSECVNL